MKYRIFATILLLIGFYNITIGQVTEGEKNLRTMSEDTTQG
jgi:hypothetical protein